MAAVYDVIIIGGGIIGLSTAYYLARRHAGKVLVLEKYRLGEGSTGLCAGGIRAQFSTEINIHFSLESLTVYERFEEEFGNDIGFKRYGYLFIATNPGELAQFRANCELQKSLGVEVTILSTSEISLRWPFLNTQDIRGGAFCKHDGYAGPYEVIQGFHRRGKELGVTYHEDSEVFEIISDRGGVHGVRTEGSVFSAGIIVNAAGPHAAIVAARAGLSIPVRPYRRQLFYTTPFNRLPMQLPLIIDYGRGWYFRREGAGLLLAGAQDRHSSFDKHTDEESLLFACENAVYRVPMLEECQIQGGWAGSYDMTPDCHAILGAAPQIKGFYYACGFSGHGFMHGPAAGMVMSELIVDGKAHTIDITPLGCDRFEKGQLIHEPMTVFKGEH
jgi:sarcosine oxidase, subunit beta